MKGLIRITTILAVFVLGISTASAENNVVLIRAAGEAYQGGPKLRLFADGRLVGERVLRKAVDTSSGMRLKTVNNWNDYVEWIKFNVPAIERVKKLEIGFDNSFWVGNGKPGNRSITVYALFVDGYGFRTKSLRAVPAEAGGSWSGSAMLWSNGRLQLLRPSKGWKSGYKAATPSN
jgi:hypothetical protein